MKKFNVRISVVFCSAVVLFLGGASAVAAIARGYVSDDDTLKPGMVVMLSPSSTAERPTVERGSSDDQDRIIGVAVTPTESSVTVASVGQEIYVESSGEVTAYVSDVEGTVKKGDPLSISSLRGILAKSSSNTSIIHGIALEDFTAGTDLETHTIQTNDGQRAVKVVRLRINFDRKPGAQNGEADSSLKRLGRSVVGKEVSEIRVVSALVIFLLVLVAEGGILYGSISSSIMALGRNPLAQNIIKQELLRVVLVTIGVLLIGLAAIYLILWV